MQKSYEDILAEAKQGPHAFWDMFDMANEGLRLHLLHKILEEPIFDEFRAQAMLNAAGDLANAYGYGSADSLWSWVGDRTLEEMEASEDPNFMALYEGLFNDASENDYFIFARQSAEKLFEAAATPEAKAFLIGEAQAFDPYRNRVYETLLDQFGKGRDIKTVQVDRSEFVQDPISFKI